MYWNVFHGQITTVTSAMRHVYASVGFRTFFFFEATSPYGTEGNDQTEGRGKPVMRRIRTAAKIIVCILCVQWCDCLWRCRRIRLLIRVSSSNIFITIRTSSSCWQRARMRMWCIFCISSSAPTPRPGTASTSSPASRTFRSTWTTSAAQIFTYRRTPAWLFTPSPLRSYWSSVIICYMTL